MENRMSIVDSSLGILPQYDQKDFPVLIYKTPVDKQGYGYVAQQSGEVLFLLVTCGTVWFHTVLGKQCVREGEGLFVNCNCVLEPVSTDGKRDAEFLCVRFAPDLICTGSGVRNRYVEPVLYSEQLQIIPFQGKRWGNKICRLLEQIDMIYERGKIGYEIRVITLLLRIWLLMYENVCPSPEETVSVSFSDKQRSRALLHYIHQNYTEKITLDDIANAAHISRGECCRIFKRLHRTTPFGYLIHYRLSKSIGLLKETDCSICQIAQQVGFGSSSYFTECFKKELHCTPHKYRQSLNLILNSANHKRKNA